MNYIPLNIKTDYDLMNSLIKIDDLVSFALNNNINTLGITDTNMFGTIEFINKCKSNSIKPIIGVPFNIDNVSFTLFCINYDGLVTLFKLVSKRNIDVIDINDFKDLNNIKCVCDIDNYDNLKLIFNDVFIKYENESERIEALKISNNIVYFPLIRYFNKEDITYFKYIKYIEESKTIDEKIDIKNSFFNLNVSDFDIKTTNNFSNDINIELPKFKLHIPKYKENSLEFLKALVKKGLDKRLNGNVPLEYKNRIMYELSIIEKMNYVDYFLIVYDFVLYAKKNNILVGPGRGSGAASLVNYALGIINTDPLKYSLIFERFLNPDRVSMPDIDIDFDNERREEVIDYVSNKYGSNNTARIISFNTMLPKQVIRDVGRVLKSNDLLIDNICKTIKDEKTFYELKNNYEYNKIINRNEEVLNLINICNKLCGLKKNTGMHAAGVVISDTPLYNFMPLYKSNDVILTGYPMEFIEPLGLLKMDFLAIKNLNTISNILKDINDNNFDINNINLNDRDTLNLFKNAYTTGIFQFESNGMKSFLKELECDSFHTLIDAIALYRPGPREMIPEYIKNKRNPKNIKYLVKELEPILKSTYGIIIYQEQVLEILRLIGGYSYAEADIIRRAMSKKKESVILESKNKFINGVISKGYNEKIGLELYNLIIKFSSYGFNKSHSVVYSLFAFQMAYLKAHYKIYFMKNLLNMNKSSDKIKEYIDESKLLGIEFSKIDINESCHEFIIKDNKLVLPFILIKSIAGTLSNDIEIEREKGKFKSFYDFMIRCYSKNINKRIVISLIECGAFDSFNLNKKQTIENIDEIINYVELCKNLNVEVEEKPEFEYMDDYKETEIIDMEINNYGFYLSFHPVTKYDRTSSIKLNEIYNYFNKTVTCILYVENVKTIKTKNNEKMSFITLSDEYKTIEGVMFPDAYKKIGEVKKNRVYKVICNVEKRNNNLQLILYNLVDIQS